MLRKMFTVCFSKEKQKLKGCYLTDACFNVVKP